MNSRLLKLRELLSERNLDALLISSLPNITYLTNFSGFSTQDRDAYLLITKTSQYLFTHGIYREAVEKNIENFELILMQRENPMNKAIHTIIAEQKIIRLGFEAFDLKVSEYESLLKQIDKKILTPADVTGELRMRKTPDEIQALKKACELGDKAFSFICKQIQRGISEKELATELEFFIKRQGADISFPPIVAFGANASSPHHVPTDIKLKQNSLVLFDFGVKLNNYCSDMTRTIFFGKATEKQRKVYEIVLNAQQKAINKIKSLILNPQSLIQTSEIDQEARNYIIAKGYPSMPHSLGHGIGLEVHESPRLTPLSQDILNEGMVFSIEPGIYLPGEFGIRLEDLFAIEGNKLTQLTNAPGKLIEL